jgi:hypothetical protein
MGAWMKRMLAAAARERAKIGRRGYSLLVLGLFDELYALSIPDATTTHTATSKWLASVLPLDAWATVWAVTGVILIAGAFARRDQWAFAAAAMLNLLWSLVYLVGWIFHGVYRGWVSAAVWAILASWVLIIATWPEDHWPEKE